MPPKIYLASDHHIRNEQISAAALTVLTQLHEAGFVAYLVGGSVRDLLLHKRPKDYDISTSAKPEEVKRLFGRQCILIGRRFRLAHVRIGPEIIEVATFRAGDPTEAALIERDNVFGTPEEDVWRRDFTINGLFYDPLDHKIIDYVDGFQDLQHHLLRTIGDASTRFTQDPVRMLRMQKFKARFNFTFEKSAERAMHELRFEIQKSSSARLLEEVLRMLESGASANFFNLLNESGFLEILFPLLGGLFNGKIESNDHMDQKFTAYLQALDSMTNRGHYKPLDRSLLLSALLFPIFESEIEDKLESGHIPTLGEIFSHAMQIVQTHSQDTFLPFPRQMRHTAQWILQMQYRLTPLDARRRQQKIIHQKDFPLALTFLKLRALVEPELYKNYEQWKQLWKNSQHT